MTARRLRRKNKSDVTRFLYVPLPVFIAGKWSWGHVWMPPFAILCQQMPTFANCQ
jgi:hypothetical protein